MCHKCKHGLGHVYPAPVLMALVHCRPDLKNARYQQTLKQGDLLLGRLQKLSKVVDVE